MSELPVVRLAVSNHKHNRDALHTKRHKENPGILIAYPYLHTFLKHQHVYGYRDWVLDSGAFSAHNSGIEINLQDYIDTCKRLRDTDTTLSEVYALDVIGDWRETLRNTQEMWRQGVEAIPTYHLADRDWSVLIGLARDYPKIAIGGISELRGKAKMQFAEQCFARVWPKRVHGFACASEKLVMGIPFHSTDATTWEMAPCTYGRWNSFGGNASTKGGGKYMSVRGSHQNLRTEIEWYLDLEKRARQRWRKEMELLG